MAHFAQLNENNEVIYVTPLNNSYLIDENGFESEQKGIDYLKSVHGEETVWVQTSYNNKFRNVYAGSGFKYDPEKDEFIPPRPKDLPSWVWNDGVKAWRPPIPRPGLAPEQYEQGYIPIWDEETTSWIIKKGPPVWDAGLENNE